MSDKYMFWGKVREGKKRGRGFGFPTANIALHKKIPEGIYASIVKLGKNSFKAAAFVGSSKTFGETDYKAEVYILNFNDNLYGKWLSVAIFKKLRENKKFSSENELIIQIQKDVQQVKDIFKKRKHPQNRE